MRAVAKIHDVDLVLIGHGSRNPVPLVGEHHRPTRRAKQHQVSAVAPARAIDTVRASPPEADATDAEAAARPPATVAALRENPEQLK